MNDDPSRRLRWYPSDWRERYGEDLLAFMEDRFGPGTPPMSARLSLVWAGIKERCRLSGLTGDSVPAPDRVRAGTVVVLGAWAVFVIGGFSLAKLSEHFDEALPHDAAAHHLPDVAFQVVQTVAGVAGLVTVFAAALAVPTLVRFLRSGGWPSIKARVIQAAVATVATAAAFVPLLVWARHLSGHQRNGGSVAYTLLFLTSAALFSLSLLLWTAVAVSAGRRVTMPRWLLAAEAGLAAVVAADMVVVLAAAAVWWAAVADQAPAFLGTGEIVATVTLMALATVTALLGLGRIVRSWPAPV